MSFPLVSLPPRHGGHGRHGGHVRHRRHVRHVGPVPPIRPIALSFLAALTSVVGALSLLAAAPPAAGATDWAPVHAGDFPDPDVIEWQGTYYAFATQSYAPAGLTTNVQVSTSTDGVNWAPLPGVDALPTMAPWAQRGDTWAPSVAYDSDEGRFVMYYTATEAGTGFQCIGRATSTTASPLGPYLDAAWQPVVCDNGQDTSPTVDDGDWGGSIDPDVFTDPQTQTSYLLWKSDGNHIGAPSVIWSVPLTSDLLPDPNATPVQLLENNPNTWQGTTIEGPDMYYRPGAGAGGAGGTYYLFYAGGYVYSTTYAIGWATCSGPAGPCAEGPTDNPILDSGPLDPGMSGPGGPDVFTLPAAGSSTGQLVMAFAAWQGSTIGYADCGIRPMYLADLGFASGGGGPAPPELSPANPGSGAAASPSCPPAQPTPPPGYWQVAADGGVFTFGSAGFYGSTGSLRLNKPVVGMAPTPDHRGYWLVASDGGVFAFGDAGFYGSTGSLVLNKPVIGMIPTLDGHGYWLVASDGGVFAFGDAPFYGSAGGDNLAYPVTAAAPSYLGGGYWMVDANGAVFHYGNAPFEGQPASAPGFYRITGMAPTHNSNGYWLSSANGNVADFGNAAPYGSMYGTALNGPIVGMAATQDGAGYWLQGSDGGIFTFGDAPFLGSMGGHPLNAPMVGIASV